MKLATPIGLVLFFTGIIAFHLYTLTKFPAPFVDESLSMQRVVSLNSNGYLDGDHYKKLSELIGQKHGQRARLSASLFALGHSIIPGSDLFSLRATSLFFGICLLVSLFFIANKFAGIAGGVLAVLITAFSEPFAQGAHLARQDIMGLAVASSVFAYSLYYNQGLLRGLICGLIVGLAFDLHERACIIGFIIFGFHVISSGFQCLKDKWIWGYTLGGAIGLVVFYFSHIAGSDSSSVNTIFLSRAPAILKMDLSELIFSIEEFFLKYISYQRGLYFFLGLALFVPFIDRKKETLNALLIAVLAIVGSGALIIYKVHFKIIAGTPFVDLSIAVLAVNFFKWVALTKLYRGLFLIVFLPVLAFNTYFLADGFTKWTAHCVKDFDEVSEKIREFAKPDDHIMSDETYWMNFQSHPFSAWKSLKFYTIYKPDSNLEDALMFFQPDLLIVDKSMAFFMDDNPRTNRFEERLRISTSELQGLVQKHGTVLIAIRSSCYGDVYLMRFNWK